ncbi:hypothetical protein M0805_007500 [Coniferiporia weirii]|nr:hypothetical protein M0805_007500 [Coniferiporia weirii]
MSSARHIHTVDPVYAPPVLRAPSPTDTISTEYGPDETSISDLTLTDEEFAKRVDEEIGLRKTKWSDSGVVKSIILPRTNDSKEEAAMFERVMANLRGEVKALEEEELFESVSLKNPGPAFAQEPTPRDIDIIMQSMLPSSNTGGTARGFASTEPKANGDYGSRVMGQRNRPILLQGHERSLTQIKFNKEGDLLFSCSKDQIINVWFSDNGERLGTYDGHNGTVWTIDVDSKTKFLVSGAADNTMKLWEVATGICLYTWDFPTAVKRVAFSEDDNQIVCITEQRMGHQAAIRVFNINREGDGRNQSEEPATMFNPIGSKPTVCTFAHTPDRILTGHESGKVALFDAKTGDEVLNNERAHMDIVTDLQIAPDRSYFITSSKDKTTRLHDTRTLQVLKTYATETPLNSAAIAPLKPYVLLGGGQDAMSVTTTSSRQGKFETRFWHKVFEEELGRVKGHFGPVNTIAVHPSGKCYASGGEDGFVRVHHFDESYFKARPYGDLELED